MRANGWHRTCIISLRTVDTVSVENEVCHMLLLIWMVNVVVVLGSILMLGTGGDGGAQ